MRMRRNQGEGDIIRKIRQFVERCNSFSSESFAPIQDDYRQETENSDAKLNPEFIQVMMLLLPYVQEHMKGELTMAQLSSVAGMDVVSLYELIMADIYKSPRDLARIIRLERVANMLKATDKTITQISEECGFSTPNYLIGTFYHQYKMTPGEYRENH
jgi:AraC-like DNA-binding protein